MSDDVISLQDYSRDNISLQRSAAIAQQIRILCHRGGYPRADPVHDLLMAVWLESLKGSI